MDDKELLKNLERLRDTYLSPIFGDKAAITAWLVALDDKDFEDLISEVKRIKENGWTVEKLFEKHTLPYTHKVDKKGPIKFFDDKMKKEIIEELKRVEKESTENSDTK